MAVQVTIKGVDKTKIIDWQSLKIQNKLTSQVDDCSFIIRSGGNISYKPDMGNEVIVYNGATKLFGGIVVSIDEAPEAYKIVGYIVRCVDYTRLLDGKLVTKSYENTPVNEIVDDIVARYGPSGFTTTNVVPTDTVDYISFNYAPISRCLKELAERFNYDWYVDYDKDIHFFAKDENAAPFALADDTGKYIFNSLILRRDNTQIKNVVIVEGGEYLADTLTATIEATGIDRVFNLPYRYEDFNATLSAQALSLGIDFSADPDDYDALFNRDEKIIKFKEADKPSAGAQLKVIGRPYLPVLVKKYNRASISAMVSAEGGDGEYEYYINDPTINSKDGAIERASAELYAYAQTISEGEFETHTDGLKSGQKIQIVSAARDIDEQFIINKVTIRMLADNSFRYKVSLVTTRTFGMIEMLQKLLAGQEKRTDLNLRKILNLVEGADEFITISESVTSSISPNPQTEAISVDESLTVQSLDYDVQFVLGAYTWGGEGSGDTKRLFILDGSRLG